MEKLWKKFSKEELLEMVNNSKNKKELAKKVGYSIESSSYFYSISEMINYYNFDISHFNRLRNQNLTGKKFGYLTVIKKGEKGNNKDTKWICQCECGKIISVQQNNLKSGNTKSCGCRSKEIVRSLPFWTDLTGEKFGYWQILGIDEEKSINGTHWKCFCTLCKNTTHSIPTMNLKQGKTLSCGCHKSSLKTLIIEKFLKENNISYQKEFTFPDLKGEGGRPLRFDYRIEKNNKIVLIEYQGKQHYVPNMAWGAEKGFEVQQKNDNKKRIYCKNNNMQLIEYSYELTEQELIKQMEADLL